MIRRFQHAESPWDYVWCVDTVRRVCYAEYNDGRTREEVSIDSPASVLLIGNYLKYCDQNVEVGHWIELTDK